ncbi:iron chelate uptake ABC transporter family permease subunit, partial [Streptomyces sp. T-3]|nr:iron chelate uptake ABC transporter family permease subunit [Streptomyces sp. T-3]
MRNRRSVRLAGLLLGLVLLAATFALSLAIGTKQVPLGEVWSALFDPSDSKNDAIIRQLRLPRTLIGLAAGAALGVAGAVMQVLTRNPLADPGLLGVNAGASAAVVTAISVFGVGSFTGYLWFALAGAAVAAVIVNALGGSRAATPV